LQQFHAAIGEDVFDRALTLRASLDARTVQGGTAPERVREQIAAHRARLGG
jgi:argininosuccinate lyase